MIYITYMWNKINVEIMTQNVGMTSDCFSEVSISGQLNIGTHWIWGRLIEHNSLFTWLKLKLTDLAKHIDTVHGTYTKIGNALYKTIYVCTLPWFGCFQLENLESAPCFTYYFLWPDSTERSSKKPAYSVPLQELGCLLLIAPGWLPQKGREGT